jgi:cell division transport system ATP-binding protein
MLIFENVTKRFGDDLIALDDINLEIEPGEFVFITGHSGSGKTTLLNLLIQEFLPTNGKITFEDCNVGKLRGNKVAKHRQQIGAVFQDYKLLRDFTVWENIALPLQIAGFSANEIKERVADLLELVDLVGFEDMFPAELSGGQAQRVGIARALATSPKLIFADEPTGNLDKTAGEAIVDLLAKINDYGTTVIVSTHDLALLEKIPTARKLTLEKGKLIKDVGKKKASKEKTVKKETKEEETDESV